MEVLNFSNLESQILTLINKGNKTFEALRDNSPLGEKTVYQVLESLVSKNILQLNTKTREYEYQTKVNGDMVILDGNVLLPTTIIKMNGKIYVSRGEWYEFEEDFDVRRIIWNVKLDSKTNSTLVDLIKSSVLKTKKSRIVQMPEYESLVNKVVPFSKKIGLHINCVGEEVTDISIIFKIALNQGDEIIFEHKGFNVRSEIETSALIDELKKPIAERDYENNIKLNRLFNFSDFIFSKNEIPIKFDNGELTYVKLTGIRKGFELTYFKVNNSGLVRKLDIEEIEDSTEAIEKLRDLFNGLPSAILSMNNFNVEMTE
jgi:hypothetical protein